MKTFVKFCVPSAVLQPADLGGFERLAVVPCNGAAHGRDTIVNPISISLSLLCCCHCLPWVLHGWLACSVFARPNGGRQAFLLPVEGNCWQLILAGRAGALLQQTL